MYLFLVNCTQAQFFHSNPKACIALSLMLLKGLHDGSLICTLKCLRIPGDKMTIQKGTGRLGNLARPYFWPD